MSAIYIGYDPRWHNAFDVARRSIQKWTRHIPVHGLMLSDLRERGLYYRPTETRDGKLWDTISGAHMATEFAISRFLVPHLEPHGWSLFMDCDMIARSSPARVFEIAQKTRFAVMCVKHDHRPENSEKMDGQAQAIYARKNWSSFMLFNCSHPSNKRLTVEMVNTLPGRDLHRFCWLEDSEIGELDPAWNYLVGHTDPKVQPKIVHFTDGIPAMPGYENAEYADEWRKGLKECVL